MLPMRPLERFVIGIIATLFGRIVLLWPDFTRALLIALIAHVLCALAVADVHWDNDFILLRIARLLRIAPELIRCLYFCLGVAVALFITSHPP